MFKYIKREIDDNLKDNKVKIQKWEDEFGSVDSHINNQECVQCGEKDGGSIYYVCCSSGKLLWWHAFLCTHKNSKIKDEFY